MSYSLLSWAQKTQNPLSALVLKTIATTDELISQLPFVPKEGESFEYIREVSIGSFGYIDPSNPTISESTGSEEVIKIPKRWAGGDFYIENFANDHAGESAYRTQLRMKLKAAGRMIADDVINGAYAGTIAVSAADTGAYVDTIVAGPWLDSYRHGLGLLRYTHSGTKLAFRAPGDMHFGADVTCAADGTYTLTSENPSKYVVVTLDVSDATKDQTLTVNFASSSHEFDGLKKIVAPSQVRASTGTNGDALSFEIMDELRDSVKVRENLFYIMPSSLVRSYAKLCRALGGVTPEAVVGGQRFMAHDGIPILRNDNIAVDESKGGSNGTLSSVYLASLAPETGVYMGALGGSSMPADLDPYQTSILGFRMYDLGQIQASNKAGWRINWYGGLALGSTLAAARAKEIAPA